MKTSQRTLILIAASTWYAGGIVLLFKAGALIGHAYLINTESVWTLVAVIAGGIAGLMKSRFLFSKSCEKNINRIRAIPEPRLWQFFRPGMLIFLAAIIPTAAWMSKAAAGHYMILCGVGALDLSIGVALLTSGRVFWKRKPFR